MTQRDEVHDAHWYVRRLRDTICDDALSLEERDSAVDELSQLAKDGSSDAQYLLGQLYRDGPLVIPDWMEARYWFGLAAVQDHVTAQYALGKLLLSDDLEVRNPEDALRWLTVAAQNGSDYAAYRLGKEYLQGKIVEKDMAKAVEWFTQAAESGNPYAQYMLGKLYLSGGEVPPNREAAVYWLAQSADQGNPYARFLLDRQEQHTPSAVALSLTRLLHHMSRIFQENSPPKSGPGRMHIDRKRLQQLREKKIAMGHKPDDHEEYQGPNMAM